jgi:hypothetical protein
MERKQAERERQQLEHRLAKLRTQIQEQRQREEEEESSWRAEEGPPRVRIEGGGSHAQEHPQSPPLTSPLSEEEEEEVEEEALRGRYWYGGLVWGGGHWRADVTSREVAQRLEEAIHVSLNPKPHYSKRHSCLSLSLSLSLSLAYYSKPT